MRTLANVCVSASTGPSKHEPENDAPRFITGALDAGRVRKSSTKGAASALVTAGSRNSQAGSVRARRCAAKPPSTVPAIPPMPVVMPSHAPASSLFINLSPDEKRVAIHRHDDPEAARSTIWVMDLYRGGTLWRFTEPGGQDPNFCPVWDAKAAELVFSCGDDRCMRVLRRPLSGGTAISFVDTKGPKL